MTVVIKQLARKSMRIGEDLFKMLLLVVALFAISFTSNAQVTIVGWDFEDRDNTADSGIPANSTKTIITEGRTGYNYTITGTGANGLAIELTDWDKGQDTKYWKVEFDASGYGGLILSSKQSSDIEGPANFIVEYSTDNLNWSLISGSTLSISTADDWTVGVISNIALPSSLDQQSSIYIRWIMTDNKQVGNGNVTSAGISRIDDIVIQGYPTNSDIISQSGYSYSELNDYVDYSALNLATYSNSRGVFGMSILDGGITSATDGLPTTLTSITFSTNGSNAIRAAALFDDTNTLIAQKIVNGITEFTIDGFSFSTPDGTSSDIELRVSFEDGVLDNEQIVFTITNAIAAPLGTAFNDPDASGAQSSNSGNDNIIRVFADQLNFVQVPVSTFPVNSDFIIEVQAVDSRGSRDLDKNLTISTSQGTGNLISASTGTILSRNTLSGTALWSDLNYDTEEAVKFSVTDDDGSVPSIETDELKAINTFSIFTFTGATGAEATFPPDYQPANATVSDISRGSNITPSSWPNAFSARSWPSPEGSGLDLDSYYEVTVTANSGYDFNLTGIQLDHRSTNTGPTDWEVRTSIDNFATNIGGTFTSTPGGSWTPNTEVNFGSSIQDQTTVTVRIYAYDASGGLGTWAIDNLKIFGLAKDIKPPAFNAGYPAYDSARLDGFHIYANIDEPATVYWQVKNEGDPIPDVTEVLDEGTGGQARGSFMVSTADSTYRQIVTGLDVASGYDVYFVLDDGIFQSPLNQDLKGVRSSDDDAILVSPVTQIPNGVIPSTADTPAEAVDVFRFEITDQGTADGSPTVVTSFSLSRLGVDISPIIAGVTLKDGLNNNIAIANQSINANGIEITLDPGALVIPDGGTGSITVGVYLYSSGLVDKSGPFILYFDNHQDLGTSSYFTQAASGSPFILSGEHSVEVTATELRIVDHSPAAAVGGNISMSLTATDENGNLDVDEGSSVTIALGQNIFSGILSGTLTQDLSGGTASWIDLQYDIDDVITLIATSSTLDDDTTGTIIIGNGITDLIVDTDFTLSSDLGVRNVVINDGARLTLSRGITLGVTGNFTFNGTGALNDLGATTSFNSDRPNALQTISKTTATTAERFYNIEINQTFSNADGVYNEMNIILVNTLSMTNGVFYIDGAANDRDFTLLSTPGSTARIGPMADGTEIVGQIIWQRSLRTGPAGFRYIGTPIKRKTLGDISDDIYIQGIAESYPWAYTNISTYSEPAGTDANEGYDGWVDFTSNTDALDDAGGKKRGMKLYLWDQDYDGEQKISMRGEPVIGDGVDGIAGNGAGVYLFPAASYTPASFDGGGWNFYANPYPCEIDWASAEITKIGFTGESVYIWNPNNESYGSYSAVTDQAINGVSQYVASGQGFFVKAISSGAVLQVRERAKVSQDGNSFLRIAEEEFPKMKLRINAENGRSDETAIAFLDIASDDYNPAQDTEKLGGGWINLSSKLDDKFIAINAMGASRGVQKIDLAISSYVFGDFSFDLTSMEGFAEKKVIRLIDKYLDKSTLLTSQTKYDFKIAENNPPTYEDRFALQFVEPVHLHFEKPEAKAGKEFILPVQADKIADVISTQVGISWDKDALSFVGIESGGELDVTDFDISEVEQGKLKLLSTSELPIDLSDNAHLFSIRFKAIEGSPQTTIEFDEANTNIKAIDQVDMPYSTQKVNIDIFQNQLILGKISSFDGEAIEGVIVKAEGEEIIENISDNIGEYSLDAFEQSSYLLSASKINDLELSQTTSTLDVLMVRRHMLQMDEFDSPYQSIAADVNGSNSITDIDLSQMRDIILGKAQHFTSGLDWLFIPASIDISGNPFAYRTSLDVVLDKENISLDFKGVRIGDINNSWKSIGDTRKSSGNIELNMEFLKMDGKHLEIPVVVRNFKEISGYQFSINWDASQLGYIDIKEPALEGHFNEQLASEGVITTMWDNINGQSTILDDGAILFVLRFIAKDTNAKTTVEISSAMTQAISFDSELNALSIKSTPANVNLEELRNGNMELSQNVPNPFDYNTEIEFKIPKSGLVRLSIVNMLGETVYVHEQDYSPGYYKINWRKQQSSGTIKPGVYLYRLESNGEEIVRKMLIK